MVAALREGRLDPEDLIDETGNVPADVLYSGFFMLAPTTIVAQRATLLENLWNDEFVRGFQAMAQWTRDQVPFPGAAFREVVELFVRRNALMDGSLRVGGREIDFADDRGERAQRDGREGHRRAAGGGRAGRGAGRPARPPATSCCLPGGHVTFGTGRSAFRHTLPSLAGWIAAHSDEQRGCVMEIRPLEPGDREALERFIGARPGGGPHVLQGGRRGPGGRRRVDAARARRAPSRSRTARSSATSPSCRCTAGRATSARCG